MNEMNYFVARNVTLERVMDGRCSAANREGDFVYALFDETNALIYVGKSTYPIRYIFTSTRHCLPISRIANKECKDKTTWHLDIVNYKSFYSSKLNGKPGVDDCVMVAAAKRWFKESYAKSSYAR